jgi:hypothetical protein
VADAHPAAVRHADAGLLAGLETVVAPSTSTVLPELRKVIVPPSPPSPPSSSEKRSRCSWSSSRPLEVLVIASSIGAGPQAQVSRSRQSGRPVEVRELEHPVGVGVQLVQR